MKKTLLLVLCALLLCGCGKRKAEETVPTTVATEPTVAVVETTEATEPPTTAPTEPPEEHFVITLAGDCTLGTMPRHKDASNGFHEMMAGDYKYPFANVVEYFENDDFTMVNLEGVLGDEGYAANKMFVFKGPADYVNILTENSVEAVTLANNHSMDYGTAGYNATKSILEEAGVSYVEKDCSSIVTTKSGLTVGLYATTFVVDLKDMKEEVASLREQGAEIVIMASHWGKEGYYYPITDQERYAHEAIDAGVDIVFGHHAHVLQKMEEYNGGLILYSMGNFSFGGNIQPPDLDTVLIQQEYIRDSEGNITKGELTVVPCSISSVPKVNNYQPTPYQEGTEEYQRVLDKLAGLWKGRTLELSY